MDISLIVLGSGQDGGSPQFGSRPTTPERTASSVAISSGATWLLLDASPDLRQQWARAAAVGQVPYRLPEAVAITHAHMGHYVGLVHLGAEAAGVRGLDLVAPASVIRHLAGNEPWAALLRDGHIMPRPVERGPYRHRTVELVGVPVPHRRDFSTTVGYSIRLHGRPWALYVPDIDSWDAWPDAERCIAEHEVALIDGTFGSDDELPHRDLAAIPHPLVTDTIDRFTHLTSATSIVLTHLNHTNPLGLDGSPLHARAEAAGFRVAHDGLVITP